MKNSTSFSHRMKSLSLVILLAVISNSTQAAVFYVRAAGDTTSWGNIAGASIITSNTPTIIPTDTYYFAKGTYTLLANSTDPIPVPITPAITTGAIYGGFSGSESVINLTTRALSDKDGNGVVEPWEFTNETILKGSTPFDDIAGSRIRLLTVTGGEVNGVTLTDHYYYGETNVPAGPFSGAIMLGSAKSLPAVIEDVIANAGTMRFCTVRKLKAGANGPVFLTNSKSVVDNCLIEDCKSVGLSANGGGGGIYMYPFGGTVSNSVLRNNVAAATGTASAGRGGAIYSAYYPSYAVPNYAIINNCAIYNNTAQNSGGAIRMEGKSGAALNLLAGQIINCSVVNNSTATGFPGLASVELIFDGQLMVNTIVVGDTKEEIRPQTNNNYYASCIYGTKNGAIVMTPGTNLVPNTETAALKFQKVSNTVGAMDSEDFLFDQAAYDDIRITNLRITDATSPAVTTTGLTTMPASFTSNANIIPTGKISATDLAGVTRTGNFTIGAYQYVPGLSTKTFKLNAYAVVNGIVVNECLGKTLSVYNMAGQLVKKVSIDSNEHTVNLVKGFYVVTVDNAVAKIIVQ